VVHELELKDVGDRSEFTAWLKAWLFEKSSEAALHNCSHLVLKHPLSAFLVAEINQVCSPKWVVVTRPFSRIEATRVRRRWYPSYGAAGAQKVYSSTFSSLIETENNAHIVAFTEFLSNSDIRRQLCSFAGFSTTANQLVKVENWLK
jgi:hypothetical protein